MSSPAQPPAASQAELKRLVGEAALAFGWLTGEQFDAWVRPELMVGRR